MSSNDNLALAKTLYSINVLVDQVGTVFFIALIWVTFRTKTLRSSRCHLLIGLYACCCLCSKTIIVFPYLIFMFFHTVPFWLCLVVECWLLLPTVYIQPLMLLISVDRLLSILFPIWYANRGDTKYHVPVMVALANILPLYMAWWMIKTTWDNPNGLMHCDFTEMVGPTAVRVGELVGFFFNFATIFAYVMILIKLLWMTVKGKSSQVPMFALYRTIVIIMAIQTGGWLFSNAGYMFIRESIPAAEQKIPTTIVNYLSSLSSSMEVPLIFLTSTEHRNAFKKEFDWLLKVFRQKGGPNATMVTPVQVISRNLLASTVLPNPNGGTTNRNQGDVDNERMNTL